MATTEMSFTWETKRCGYETMLTIEYHRTGPAFIITHIVESNGWPIVPDPMWDEVEDAAHQYVADLIGEEYD